MNKITHYINIVACSVLLACMLPFFAYGRVPKIDSLKNLLLKQTGTVKVETLLDIGDAYYDLGKNDTTLIYCIDALKLAEAIDNKQSIFVCLKQLARFYEQENNFPLALEFGLRAQKMAEEEHNKQEMYDIYTVVGGFIYFNHGNYDTALAYGLKMMKIAGEMKDTAKMAYAQMSLGDEYRALQKFDSALSMYARALNLSQEINNKDNIVSLYNDIALVYDGKEKFRDAIPWFLKSIAEAQNDGIEVPDIIENAAFAYCEYHNFDSALLFAKKFLAYSNGKRVIDFRSRSYRLLAKIYSGKKMYGEAYYYLHKYVALDDSVNLAAEQNKLDLLGSGYKTDKQKREIDLLQKNSELQGLLRNVLIATAMLLLVTAFLITNKYNHKKKAEAALALKNNELSRTLTELKSTQSQLIQSEKMASLGELTAGIAHEIQNPLNFVNNFSEVSIELAEELKEEIYKSGISAEIKENIDYIVADLVKNQQKINFHGKRADAIVKGMLQHSRKSTGQKELTDINALAGEYLQLSYHGLRAKDKTFNAGIKTYFDDSIGKINIIPQDIGRVLLNLFNNAFYAVTERLKEEGDGYKPEVTVTTKKVDSKIEIRVADNGNGIPQKIIDKIYQPFFTTKPTGQGTGLGLSLSYDIVKAHGGEIRVETKEGESTEFIVQLPAGHIRK